MSENMPMHTPCDLPIAEVPTKVATFEQLRDFERKTCARVGAFVRPVCDVSFELHPNVSKETRADFTAQKYNFCVIMQLYPGARTRNYVHGKRAEGAQS
jgi:hypothetical protein